MLDEVEFDDLLRRAIPRACYEDCCEIEEQMQLEGKHVFTDEFEKKMKKLFQRRKLKRKNAVSDSKEGRGRVKFRYFLVAVLLLLLSASTVLAYEPARDALKNIVYTIFGDHITIHPTHDGTYQEGDVRKTDLKRPVYIPEGYELYEEIIEENTKSMSLIWFNSTDNNVLLYEQSDPQYGETILSTSGNSPESIQIGEIEGKIIYDMDERITIFYEEQNMVYIVSGVLEQEELVRIILSIE